MKLLLTVDENDLALIFAGFTRIEHGPKTYAEIKAAWKSCTKVVQQAYVEEALKYLEAFRQDHDRRHGTSEAPNPVEAALRRIEKEHACRHELACETGEEHDRRTAEAPTPMTSAAEARKLNSYLRAQALSYLNDQDRGTETGGDGIAALVSLLREAWDNGYDYARRSRTEALPEPFDREKWFMSLRAGMRVGMYREGTIAQFVGLNPYMRWDDGEHDVIPRELIVPCRERAKP